MIELDRHLEILLLGNDCVIVPDFGGFMAHHVEARKDGADGMFLPPSRTIGFNPKLTLNDSLLAQSYVECYDVSYPEALRRIEDEVRELRQHIENDGCYELHGIGVVSLNGDGHLVFEPCEAGILTPSLYGLSGFEMLSLDEMNAQSKTPSEIENVPEVPQIDEGVCASNGADDHDSTASKVVMLWRTVAAACVAVLMFLLFPTPLDNNNRLQTAGTVNVELLQRVFPQTENVAAAEVTEEAKGVVASVAAVAESEKETPQKPEEGFVIVLASRVTQTNALAYMESLRKRGYAEARVVGGPRHTRVVYGLYDTQAEANQALNNLRKDDELKDAWVMKYHQ